MIKIEDIAEDEIVFYDLETTHQYAPYTDITLVGYKVGFEGKVHTLRWGKDDCSEFLELIQSPDILKVGFNNLNFDDIVLARHGYPVCETNRHDGFLIIKTIAPNLPSYSLKFLNWWYLGDPHWPEFELDTWAQKTQLDKWQCPLKLLPKYLEHDLQQHQNIFCLGWEKVQEERHWNAYNIDLSQGKVVEQMTLRGGLYIDTKGCEREIALLQKEKAEQESRAFILSDGEVENPNSSKQVGAYLDLQGFELELSANGEFAVRKSDLVDLKEKDPVANCAYEVRRINGQLKYFENYLAAAHDTTFKRQHWIPTSYSISAAGTRRYLSSSYHGINFQNSSPAIEKILVIPRGWIGFKFDSTQIENVVHIYESRDGARRRAYEANDDWNEYVWLCNRILGTNHSKKELDDRENFSSPQIPNWTVYKQYKTVKLALNFGMGIRRFCSTTGVSLKVGEKLFADIHEACPAIRGLQDRVQTDIERKGFVQDVFGHIYRGTPRMAYKVVAYLIQGCGTGSLPKAQMRLNYETLQQVGSKYACLCTTTHDDNSGRISLALDTDTIIALLQEMYINMTEKYRHKFDNIPLRVKMYLTRTSIAEQEEVDIDDHAKIEEILNRR